MENKRYFLFIVGLIFGYFLLFPFLANLIGISSQPGEYQYVKTYSTINETRTIENNNYKITVIIESPNRHADRIGSFPQGGDLPYYVTLSIRSKTNEIQWIKAPEKYLKIDLYNNSKKVSTIISIDDPYTETMGIFLAPNGVHELSYCWRDRHFQNALQDGRYELFLLFFIEGNEYSFDGLTFDVETKLVKIKTGIVL